MTESAPGPESPRSERIARVVSVVLVFGAIAAGYFARDFGLTPAKAPAQAAPADAQPAAAVIAAVAVRVSGERCHVAGGLGELCTTACEAVARRSTPETPVDIDGTKGTQGAVQELTECLTNKGYRTVRLVAGPPGVDK